MKCFRNLFMQATVLALCLSSCGGNSSQQGSTENDSTQVCKTSQTSEQKFQATVNFGTGVNVSHWLSQSKLRGEERANLITKKDFDSIAAMGFDHVRIPIDEEHFYDEEGNRLEDGFQLLHNAIKWSLENNLKVIVDLHVIRSHHFNNENSSPNTLFTEEASKEQFIQLWKNLQKELKDYPKDKLAYEIMNEPVAPSCNAWNELIDRYIKTIRKTEPDRTLVIGSNMWQVVQTFDSLVVPNDDKNIVLSFHSYDPLLITHHQAPWTAYAYYKGEVNYPGLIIEDTAFYKDLDKEQLLIMRGLNTEWDKEIIEQNLMKAINVADSLGLQLYCGEFGAYPYFIKKEIRLKWYDDITSIFRAHNIGNAHWCYKGDFPIVNEDGSANELPAILTKK